MMQLCSAQKHYYDNAQYGDCPYCRASINPVPVKPVQAVKDHLAQNETLDLRKTTPLRDTVEISPKTVIKTAPNALKTVMLHAIEGEGASPEFPVVGWLVITDGVGKGKDFRLIQGENRIGRSAEYEICLDFGAQSDVTISRETHATVVYDTHANEFFIERGRSRNLPLLNGAAIRGEPTLQHHDKIQIGQTTLVFVALCGAQFHW